MSLRNSEAPVGKGSVAEQHLFDLVYDAVMTGQSPYELEETDGRRKS